MGYMASLAAPLMGEKAQHGRVEPLARYEVQRTLVPKHIVAEKGRIPQMQVEGKAVLWHLTSRREQGF